jgi:FkbM family methyltransferase
MAWEDPGSAEGGDVESLKQYLFERSLEAYPGAALGKARESLVLRAARAYSRLRRDPDVRFTWRGVTLTLPFSHQLPGTWSVYDDYSQNLARVAAACERRHMGSTMIDVGANVGDSVVVVRTLSKIPVLCVEGDPRYLRYLGRNTAQYGDVEIAPYYVGDEDGERRASVVSEGGSAHLEFDAHGGTCVSLRTLQTLVSEHPRFDDVSLLKIDTDGFDVRILMASSEFLQAHSPVVFFEYDPRLMGVGCEGGLSVYPFLRCLGYEGVVVWDNLGDYLVSTTTSESALLAHLHHYFAGGYTHRYTDVAVFPSAEANLFDEVTDTETAHRRSRLGGVRASE